jgi:hypothetical protein
MLSRETGNGRERFALERVVRFAPTEIQDGDVLDFSRIGALCNAGPGVHDRARRQGNPLTAVLLVHCDFSDRQARIEKREVNKSSECISLMSAKIGCS